MIYRIRHTYKPKVIIPYIGIDGTDCTNLDFLLDNGERFVTTPNDIRCRVLSCEEKHLCDLEDEIMKIYNCNVWSWIKRWHNIDDRFCDMRVLVLELEQV